MQILRGRKRIFNHIHHRLAPSVKTDFRHVKPHQNARFTQQLEPCNCPLHNQRLLGRCNRLRRGAILFAAAALYLYEHQRLAVTGHQVNLAPAGSTKIAIENLVPRTAQCPRGLPLSLPAQLGAVIPRRGRAALSSGE